MTLASAQPINFSQTAEALNIPQPHLSNQIKHLEKELGVELFNRKQRPPVLTPAGHQFLQETRHLLAQLEHAKVAAQQAHRGEVGYISIGINASASNSIFPQVFQRFRATFPSVSATLYEMASYQQVIQLKDRQLDVGLFHLDNLSSFQAQDQFEIIPILTERLIVVLPEQHPLTQHPEVRIADLSTEEFILPSAVIGGLRSQIVALCQQNGFFPRIKQEAAWITTFLSLVACNMGIALLPENAQNLQRTGIVYRPIQGESPTLTLVAVWRKGDTAPVLHNFLMILQQFVKS
ncbi:MAG: LysR family transcriptional regulator [Leptolyngbyaceae cyanobacterium bins.349]|nr:LysR family transcriptional regulator [Leptolyngbyaceae cyanobacterium bins.349]